MLKVLQALQAVKHFLEAALSSAYLLFIELSRGKSRESEVPLGSGFRRSPESVATVRNAKGATGHTWMSEYAVNREPDRSRPLRLADAFRIDQKSWKTVSEQAGKSLEENSDMADIGGGLMAGH
ncbi:hypothetical protein [Methylococcus geothermalis]|uniref:Uncharacterized protein n=1 Tax=Methylococcus geothermalis TaxID=2681310 RepID=A0A858Q5T4_9GAMM|nr:hypothetical protein [Methylococcus geothermalis]QJD29096.1 hypothetical protein GNH96_03335 [Methylococcus geothermalis]